MTEKTAQTDKAATKAELLAAIRKQTEAAGNDLPGPGAAALRNLAEAYAVVTAPDFPGSELLSAPADEA